MGFQDTAYVFAGHLVILMAGFVFLARMIPMAASARRAEVGYGALTPFPACSMLLALMAMIEAVYYGLARVLIDDGVDLWAATHLVGVMRIGIAASLYWHLPAYLRWRGVDESEIPKRVATEASALVIIWALCVKALW